MVHQISPNQTYFNLDCTHFCPFLPIVIDGKYIYTLVWTLVPDISLSTVIESCPHDMPL